MSITNPSPISMPSYTAGIVAPVTGASAVKAGAAVSIEEALNILSLVNVGNSVLDISTLDQDPAVLVKIASGIINARKTGSQVEFANGRINVPQNIFSQIVDSSRSQPVHSGQIGMSKASKQDGAQQPQQAQGAGQEKQAPQFTPLFAPPPPVFEKEKRKERLKSQNVPDTSAVREDESEEGMPQLTSAQAYHILVDIVPPGGGKYIIHVNERFRGSEEDNSELEKGLDDFWKDFGRNMSVTAKLTNFTVKPIMLIGNMVNQSVSKRLILVYVSQSTSEKLSSERIVASTEKVSLRPSTGDISIDIYSRELIEYLLDNRTARSRRSEETSPSARPEQAEEPYDTPGRGTQQSRAPGPRLPAFSRN